MEPAIALLTDCSDLDGEAEIRAERATGIYAQMEELVADNAQQYQDQNEHRERYVKLNRRYMVIKARQTSGIAALTGSQSTGKGNDKRLFIWAG